MSARATPEMIRLNARLPRGQDGYWAVIRKLGAGERTFTIGDIDGETNAPAGAVQQYVRRLVKGGFLKQIGARPNRAGPMKLYRFTAALTNPPKNAPRLRPDGTPCAPRKQDQLWRAMRSLRQFGARELAYAASTPECKVSKATAHRYVNQLHAAGYLTRAGTPGANAGCTFRLKPGMNTGPLSPVILRVDAIYDRNLQRMVGDAAEAVEVAS